MKQQNKLYKLPTHITIFQKKYKIKYYDRTIDADEQKLWGQADSKNYTIRIYRGKLPIATVWHTLMHEILHLIAEEAQLDCLSHEKYHDELDRLALYLVNVICKNSEAFSFKDFADVDAHMAQLQEEKN